MKNKRILIYGPYGGANLGDDLIGISICNYFLKKKTLSTSITLLNNKKSFDSIENLKFEIYPNLRRFRLGVLKTISSYDLIVVGGGQQITEPRLINPFWGHLSHLFWLSFIAKTKNVEVHIHGIGASKKLSHLGKLQLNYILKNTKIISARDKETQKMLLQYNRKVKLTNDLIFLDKNNYLKNSKRIIKNNIEIIFFPNSSVGKSSQEMNILFIEKLLLLTNYKIHVCISDIQRNLDVNLLKIIKIHFGDKLNYNTPCNISELFDFINSSEIVVTTRLHPSLLAMILNKKHLAINLIDKLYDVGSRYNMNIIEPDHFLKLDKLPNLRSKHNKISEIANNSHAFFDSFYG